MQNPRVLSSGGAFSTTPKVNYSKETQDYVNLLMKEAHLTNMQRKGFSAILRSGDSLPSNPNYTNQMLRQRFQMKRRAMCRQLGIESANSSSSSLHSRRARSLPRSGRRSLQQIVASGAYEPDPLRPYVAPAGNKKEEEIARLQYQMAFGTQKPDESTLVKGPRNEAPSSNDQDDKESRLTELIDEIGDRIDFLNSMHEIGRDKVYRGTIEFQIREKLTELEQNYPRDVKDIVKHFGLEKFMSRIETPM